MKSFISFSGGVESTTLCLLFGHRAQAIFADTGAEHKEMYERLDYVETQMRKIHPDFHILRVKAHKPDGKDVDNLTDYIIDAGVFPNQVMRFCTKYFKIKPIENYLKPHLPCSMMIGLNYGEEVREGNNGSLKGCTIEYPLQDLKITRQACIDLLMKYDLEPKLPVYMKRGGCIYCPYKGRKEYIAMCHLDPETMERLALLEEQVNKRERNGKKRKKFWAAANAVPEGFRKLMEKEEDSMFNADEMYGHEPTAINTSCGLYCNR